MKKTTFRRYSEEELKFLNEIIKTNKPASQENIGEFCKKYKRSMPAVGVYIYTNRKKLKNTGQAVKNSAITPLVSKGRPLGSKNINKREQPGSLTSNEFIIPITNWEIRTENGNASLILKFK